MFGRVFADFLGVTTITIEPIKKNINQFKTRKTLINENENLKKALNVSYLNNYLISRENKFYKDKNIIKHPFDENKISKYSVAKVKDLDPNIFNCCDKHRMYIEIISNNKQIEKESVVFNSSGIIASGNSWRIFSLKCFSSGPRNKTAL